MSDYTLRVDAGLFCNVEADSEEEARARAAEFFTAALERGFTVFRTHPGESGSFDPGPVSDLRIYANNDAEPTIEDVYDPEEA